MSGVGSALDSNSFKPYCSKVLYILSSTFTCLSPGTPGKVRHSICWEGSARIPAVGLEASVSVGGTGSR